MEFRKSGNRQVQREGDWLSGHQRPWVFERVLLVANSAFGNETLVQLQENSYTVEMPRTASDALRRIIQSEFDAVLCQVTPEFPAEMFYRGIERVRPYLTRRLLFFVDAHTDPSVSHFIRKMKIVSVWHPTEPHILFETITSVVRKTTNLTEISSAARVRMINPHAETR